MDFYIELGEYSIMIVFNIYRFQNPIYVCYMQPPLHDHLNIKLLRYGFTYLEEWNPVSIRPHWRLYHNPDNGAVVRHEDDTCRLGPENLVLMPPNTAFQQSLESPCHTFYIHFSLSQSYGCGKSKFYEWNTSTFFCGLIDPIINTFKSDVAGEIDQPWFGFKLHALVYASLASIPKQDLCFERYDPRVEKIFLTLREDPLKDHSNQDLALEVKLSTNAMVRLFRQNVGIPPQNHLRNLRLRHAAQLLANSEMSLDIIAQSCRFCDRHYFSKCFKALFKVGPAHYRKYSRQA